MRKPYPPDLTDERAEIILPSIPVSEVGRPREVDTREVLNAIFYLLRSGCRWGMLPHDPLPEGTAYDYFARGRDDGPRRRIMGAPRRQVRKAAGKESAPSAGSIDSRTAKGGEVGGGRGYDGGKKVRGLKRHIIVAALGLLPVVVVSAAAADAGTFAPEVLGRLTAEHRTRLELVRADGKYHNHRLRRWPVESGVSYVVEVVSRPPGSKGWVELPRRWVVERTFARLGRYRRNSRDYDWHPQSSEAMLRLSSVHRMLRLLRPDRSKPPIPFKYRESQGKITG